MRLSIFWVIAFYFCCNLFLEINAIKEKRCQIGIEIRNAPRRIYNTGKFNATIMSIFECTVIDGDFTISFIPDRNYTDKDFIPFKNLQEITGRLLIYNVKGLTNLGHIFPNLKIIGGETLLSKNALIIYQNDDLHFIGLNNLKIIRNGGVRISDNPKLCYSKSINWENILIGNFGEIKIERNGYDGFLSGNGNERCQDLLGCEVDNPEQCQKRNGMFSCWEPKACQIYCPYHKLSNNKIGPGCSKSTGEKCHSSCLGGCEIPNDPTSCYACRKQKFGEECVDKCPSNTFQHLDNRCLTKTECHNLDPVTSDLKKNTTAFKAFNGKCHYECPDGYQEDLTNIHSCIVCNGYCPRKCFGGNIFSVEEALIYEKCNIIEGNLNIEMESCEKAEEFTKAFGNIREITGSLLIRFSPTFTSLHMFKNLEIIHGNELVNDRYALSVMELENLRQIFKQNITIKNGLINFESNPKLCYSKIMDFVKSVGLEKNVSENDISKYSNGEKAICDAPILLDFYEGETDQRQFGINFKLFNTTNLNHTKLLGYTVYYKKVDKIDPNIEMGDNEACGDENQWKSKFVRIRDYVALENLEPNSFYAYYIQTKVIRHPEAKNAISKIGFSKTPFNIPGMPKLTKAEALGPNKILLEWDPPVKANGIITHYTVMWNAKSVGKNSIEHDSCGNKLNLQYPSTSFSSTETKSTVTEKCQNCVIRKTAENTEKQSKSDFENDLLDKIYSSENEEWKSDVHFEDTVLNDVYSIPAFRKQAIEYHYFDQYNLHRDDPESSTEKSNGSFPEILNENKTFGRANISTARVILTGLFHYTEYYIQIIACQDITVPENYCSKQAASRIIRTHSIPENDIIDLNTIKVLPYIINGTEQEDSRIISWKFPENPNGAIAGFRYKIWKKDHSIERCISKEDYEKTNNILIHGLKNGIYTLEIRTISSVGVSAAAVKKDLFEIHVSCPWEYIFFIASFAIIVSAASVYLMIRFWNSKNVKKYAQTIIHPSKGQEAPLL